MERTPNQEEKKKMEKRMERVKEGVSGFAARAEEAGYVAVEGYRMVVCYSHTEAPRVDVRGLPLQV